MDRLLHKLEDKVDRLLGHEHKDHSHTTAEGCDDEHPVEHRENRYHSFAPQTSGVPKWYVDGASYFWAVSEALEQARESIYILDWWLSPELYLRRPPARNEQYRLDRMLQAAAERGVQVRIIVYKEVPQALTLNSAHTKHALEALHPNIRVFRHPDHVPSANDVKGDLLEGFQNLSLGTFRLSTLPRDTLAALYGTADDVVLFWAHHEKLLVVDSHLAFMGGLDMCFGRYDTNSHPIADAHPGDLNAIVFPGQDYNNARVYDFESVDKWENNKLDRTVSSRMGWSDISISLSGNIVNSLILHFTDRWNYIWEQKYRARSDVHYEAIGGVASHAPPAPGLLQNGEDFFGGLQRHFRHHLRQFSTEEGSGERSRSLGNTGGGEAHIQLTRSACPWSSGKPTEHSIANAYIEAITNAQHFVYIENQFFITATSDEQKPVHNKLGEAIVNRIVRAHQNNELFHIFVLMPAVPAFAGDLKSDGALGTRAIMEYQYNSISRGGHSILESARNQGVDDPHRFINFYNLRNFDRINTSAAMQRAEEQSGVSYESARREFDDAVESGYDGYGREPTEGRYGDQYRRYQEAAERTHDRSVCSRPLYLPPQRRCGGLLTALVRLCNAVGHGQRVLHGCRSRPARYPLVWQPRVGARRLCVRGAVHPLQGAHRRRSPGHLRLRQPQRPLAARRPRLRDSRGHRGPVARAVAHGRAGLHRLALRGLAPPPTVPKAPGPAPRPALRPARRQLDTRHPGPQPIRLGLARRRAGRGPPERPLPRPLALDGPHQHRGAQQGLPQRAQRRGPDLGRLRQLLLAPLHHPGGREEGGGRGRRAAPAPRGGGRQQGPVRPRRARRVPGGRLGAQGLAVPRARHPGRDAAAVPRRRARVGQGGALAQCLHRRPLHVKNGEPGRRVGRSFVSRSHHSTVSLSLLPLLPFAESKTRCSIITQMCCQPPVHARFYSKKTSTKTKQNKAPSCCLVNPCVAALRPPFSIKISVRTRYTYSSLICNHVLYPALARLRTTSQPEVPN
ncbi:hypothetical protein RB595_006557 [Gaeumannomyces hyphopodioides]